MNDSTEGDSSIRINVDYVDDVADSNDIGFHEWQDRIHGSPATLGTSSASSHVTLFHEWQDRIHGPPATLSASPSSSHVSPFHEWQEHIHGSPATLSASPASSHISLPSTGSEQEFAHQFDTLGPPSPDSLFAFGALSATISALSRLSHDGAVYNGFSNSPTTSSYGFPSPTPSNASSSYFSDSGWEDGNYLSANHSYHSNGSAELLLQSPQGTNSSSGLLSPYEETFSSGPLSSANHSYHSNSSAELLPQSPLGTNSSSGFLSSYEEIFPPGIFPVIPGSPDQRSPDQRSPDQLSPYSLPFSSASSSEPLTGVSDPPIDDFLSSTLGWDQIFHPGPESPYPKNLSQPEFTEGSSSQPIPCKVEAPDPRVFKSQVASDAAIAVSDSKRKNPAICTCDICGRGFTRKHSRASHMLAHTGERTKLCQFCGNRFAGTLSRHKKTCKDNPNREPPKRKRS